MHPQIAKVHFQLMIMFTEWVCWERGGTFKQSFFLKKTFCYIHIRLIFHSQNANHEIIFFEERQNIHPTVHETFSDHLGTVHMVTKQWFFLYEAII